MTPEPMKYSATAATPIQIAMRVVDGFPLSSPGPRFGSNGSLTRPCYPWTVVASMTNLVINGIVGVWRR